MKTNKLIIRICTLVALAGGCILLTLLTSSEVYAADTPSGDFLAAALVDQEEKCGGSLEINYTSKWQKLVDGQQTEQRITQYHYIRTPEAVRVEMIRSGSVATTSYDRNTNEYRMLSQQETDNPSGKIGTGLGDPLGVRHLLETVRYPLHQGPLCEKIKLGTASEQTEQIDGFDCIRVEIPSQKETLEKYIVWLDPTIGYNPRRIEFIQKNTQAHVITFADYEQIGSGVWFPKKQIVQYASKVVPTERFIVENTVTEVKIGRTIAKDEVLVRFPSGTHVIAGDVEFTVE